MGDARALNAMSEETRLGHSLLTRWAQTVKKDNPQPWPSITMLGRIIEQGGHYGSVTGVRPATELPEDVAAVDALVSHMRGEMRIAVLAYYGKWETLETVARGLRWAPAKLSFQLRMAREAVALSVSAQKNLYREANPRIPASVAS